MFSEIREKKQELSRLEQSIVDMEGQRQRKDREFARLQVRLFVYVQAGKARVVLIWRTVLCACMTMPWPHVLAGGALTEKSCGAAYGAKSRAGFLAGEGFTA